MNRWIAASLAHFLLLASAGECWARGGGGCLEEGTPILTPSGPVLVERLQPGSEVWTVADDELRRATVHARIEVQPDEYLELVTASRRIRVTAEHPFLIAPGVFRQAASLCAGDRLWLWHQEKLTATTLEYVGRVRAERPAFNLLVSPGGTYLANGFIVHNKGCFLPDTAILKEDGEAVPIRDIKPGDQIRAFTPEGKILPASVREVLTHEVDEYAVVTTERIVLRVTLDHPFYVGAGTFRTLSALRAGDWLIAYDGTGLSPQRIIQIQHVRQRTRVYNLQTDAPHTFFANGIAVHNKGGGGGGGGGGGFSGGGWHGSGSHGHGGGELPQGVLVSALLGGLLGGTIRAIVRARLGLFRQFSIGALLGAPGGLITHFFLLWDVGLGVFIAILSTGIIASGFRSQTKTSGDLDYLYSQRDIDKKAKKTQKLLEDLSQQDSSVEPESLRSVAETTFRKLQECWQDRDYDPMKPLLMPDLFAQHTALLDGMKRHHEINRIDKLHVERIDLVNIRYADKPDNREFTALITARAQDYYVDDRSHGFLRGDAQPARFQEFWTFHRQADAWLLRDVEQTRESGVLKEENFVERFTDPQVQAVYEEAAGAQGPAGPWLEKQVETKMSRIERLLNILVQTDKLWDQEKMCLRARQVFANVYLAQEAGNSAAVKTDELFPNLAASLQEQIQARQARGTLVEFRNFCVRKVDLVLVRNFADNSADEFTARIRAHAQRIVRRGSTLISRDEYVSPFEEYWTFGRLNGQWRLKEVLPPAKGRAAVTQENVDEESSPDQWYYRQTQAN